MNGMEFFVVGWSFPTSDVQWVMNRLKMFHPKKKKKEGVGRYCRLKGAKDRRQVPLKGPYLAVLQNSNN
jgi:hypothetical protein